MQPSQPFAFLNARKSLERLKLSDLSVSAVACAIMSRTDPVVRLGNPIIRLDGPIIRLDGPIIRLDGPIMS